MVTFKNLIKTLGQDISNKELCTLMKKNKAKNFSLKITLSLESRVAASCTTISPSSMKPS